ncbi:MAG: GxxExxY protein [bacterium]|nr:GxxExxY protein [bacterium]
MREPTESLNKISYDVIGAAIEVHRILGPGFLESIYEEALTFEFNLRGLQYQRQLEVGLTYKNHPVGQGRLDFMIGDELVLEIKAVDKLAPIHESQVLSYLKSTHRSLGLLINFNVSVLKDGIKRIVLS